jgi:hypothetical protein
MAGDDIQKIKADEQALEQRKRAMIDELLKKREAFNRDIDAQLAELDYHANGAGKPRRSHHRKAEAKPKAQGKE